MQCKDVELVLEQEGLAPLPASARVHVAECASCQSFVADLTTIVAAAHMLPMEVEPPTRVWTSLRTQLESEGIIKQATPAYDASQPAWWTRFAEVFRGRVLVTASIGLIVLAAAVVQFHKPTAQPKQPVASVATAPTTTQPSVATISKPAPSAPLAARSTAPRAHDSLGETASALDAQETDLSDMNLAGTAAGRTDDVDRSLRQNLQTVNEFIRECERRIKEAPDDQLAHEYLAGAYRQKAELLSAILERRRSVN